MDSEKEEETGINSGRAKTLKKGLYKNAAVTLIAQSTKLILQFVLQRVFIDTLGAEYLGYNSVFKNILQMLNMADLGVGLAITGYLYAPLADEDHARVSALMHIYKNVYHAIGCFVAFLGVCLTIMLPWIIPDANCGYGYLRVLFLINLISVLCTYFLAYKRTLLIANQQSYYVNTVDLAAEIVGTAAQVLCLYLIPNYIIYLVINISKTLAANIIINRECDKKYNLYIDKADKVLVDAYKSSIGKYIGDVFVSRIGGFIFSGTDNIIISAVLGSLQAGFLSNYTIITGGIKGFVAQVLSSVQATYGNYIVKEPDKSKCRQMTDNYLYADYVAANVCMLCCVILFQPFVRICFGGEFVLENLTPILLSVNLSIFILLLIPTQVFTVYRLYKYEKPVVMTSAILNIIISIALTKHFGINGTLIGTTITSIIYLVSRLFVVSKWVFEINFTHYIKKLVTYGAISAVTSGIMCFITKKINIDSWISFFIYAVGIAAVSLLITLLATCKMKEQRFLTDSLIKISRRVYWCILLVLLLIGAVCIGYISLTEA